ncbi:hypothetical protein GCM10023213_20230 [Prosthecobacter algae]|uniref:Uncharacterized protein n=1 Tax=Prosthecobacter algae TaxID=1144682 RepID=A0ABP9P8M2_9BACT
MKALPKIIKNSKKHPVRLTSFSSFIPSYQASCRPRNQEFTLHFKLHFISAYFLQSKSPVTRFTLSY